MFIHPVKAGLCSKAEEYSQSSYCDYMGETEEPITDISFILDMLEKDALIRYAAEENEERFLDIPDESDLPKTDQEAKNLLAEITGCKSASAFQRLDRQKREAAFRKLNENGIAIAQISRITGVSRPVIYRALEE